MQRGIRYPKHPPPIHFVVKTVTMKLFGIIAFWGASSVSSFTVPVVPSSVQRSTALFDSRRRKTIAKRTEWLKNRGVSSDATTSSVDTESSYVAPGLVTSESGLEYVQLVHPDTGATSQVYLYGGVVTSYCDKDGTEFIAVRPDAVMDGSKPISGGLSHCFPQFGPGAIQQHGFARNVAWAVDTISDDSVTLSLAPNDYTKAIWDAAFRCTFTVTLEADQLATKLVVDNTGSEPWSFQAALHSYFTVSALDALEITGSFKGKEFLNKMAGADGAGEMQTETRDSITIAEEYDRVYTGVNDPVLKDSGTGKALAVLNTAGWEDTVLWNPYGNEKMGYNNFVCVESVKFDAVTLEGGASWVGDMALKPSTL
jgi:glucose-6-phosphate 1-epimerase